MNVWFVAVGVSLTENTAGSGGSQWSLLVEWLRRSRRASRRVGRFLLRFSGRSSSSNQDDPNQDEHHLFQAISRGDEEAFELFFDTYYNRIYTIAYRMTRSKQVAEELAISFFGDLWISRRHLAAVSSPRAYIHTGISRKVVNFLKSEGNREQLKQRYLSQQEGSVSDADYRMTRGETSRLIEAAINRLPLQKQKIYRLRKEQGLSYHEIASKLGLSVLTVRSHLHEAMKRLREELKRR